MKNVIVVTLSVLASTLGCSPESPKALKPPRVKDQAAAIAHHDPTAEFLKPNPRPAPWMPGCYSLVQPILTESKYWPVARAIQLTTEPYEDRGIQQRYRIRSLDPRVEAKMWAWKPLTQTTVQLGFSDGYVGWQLELRKAPKGMFGSASSFSDGPSEKRTVAVQLVRIACSGDVRPN